MIVCFGIVAVVVVVIVDVSVSLRVFLRFALIELVCVCARDRSQHNRVHKSPLVVCVRFYLHRIIVPRACIVLKKIEKVLKLRVFFGVETRWRFFSCECISGDEIEYSSV